jgi:branched-chain amino acid aminotransferase
MAVGEVVWTYFNGGWHRGDMPVMNAADHGTWLGSLVFDGARAFEGVVPDLEPHLARVNNSARVMGLKPTLDVAAMIALVMQGLSKFSKDAPVYIRPMYWSREGGAGVVVPDPDSTVFCLCLEQLAMAPADAGQTLCSTGFVRPMITMAPVDAKAACLYPNNGRMIREDRRAALTTRWWRMHRAMWRKAPPPTCSWSGTG